MPRDGRVSLLVATPVRAAEQATALVTWGYCNFRLKLAELMRSHSELWGGVTPALDGLCRGRNRVVGELLTKDDYRDVSHVLWVDDDTWPADVAIVPYMIEHCKGILGAGYTGKKQPLRWTMQTDASGTFTGIGFGFTMTTRECLQKLADGAKWYVDYPGAIRTPNVFGQLYETIRFPDGTEAETLLSEDYSFCKRAREAGYRIELLSPDAIVYHAGGHAWSKADMLP